MTTIPGVLTAMEYDRTSGQWPKGIKRHNYRTPATISLRTDGGLTVTPRTPGARLWSRDPNGEPQLDDVQPNPYLVSFNPRRPTMKHHRHPFTTHHRMGLADVTHFFSVDYLTAGASGIAGFGVVGLGEFAVFNFLTFLTPYRAGTTVADIGVRGIARVVLAFLADLVIGKTGWLGEHTRKAFAAGAGAYAIGATGLELIGYSMAVGSGLPLTSVLPASLQPPALQGYVDRPSVTTGVTDLATLRDTGRYIPRPRAGVGDIYFSPLHPMRGQR